MADQLVGFRQKQGVNQSLPMKRLFTCIFLLWVLRPGLIRAQAPLAGARSEAARFRFEHLTVNEGLSHSDAMCAVQDKAGFIWIGTHDGINRYDGYGLKKYQLPINTRNGLSSNRIHALHVDPQGRLWAGSEGAGLSLFDADHDRFVNISERVGATVSQASLAQLSLAEVVAITTDSTGRLWVGTLRHGLFMLRVAANNTLSSVEQVALPTHVGPDYGITALVTGRDGTLWVGTPQDGLWAVVPGGGSSPVLKTTPFTHRNIRTLHSDPRGNLWVGADNHIFWVYQPTQHSFSTQALPQLMPGLECLFFDSMGQLWAGTIYGLYMWQPRTTSGSDLPVQTEKPSLFMPRDDDPLSINSARIHQIFEDTNQILWLSASAGGLNKINLRYKPFVNLYRQYAQRPTLANNFVNALYKDEARNCLWIGTRNGFSRYDLTTKTYRNYANRQLPGDATGIDVCSFHQTADGRLWVGTRYDGLYVLDGEKLTLHTAISDKLSLASTSLESIVEDKYGTLWIGTLDLGLMRFDRAGRLLQHIHTGNSTLPTNRFTFLLYDTDKDLLWASTRGAGVLKLQVQPQSIRLLRQFSYQPNDTTSLSVNFAWPLLKDHRGSIWIGTIGGGLNQIVTNGQGREVIRRYDKQIPASNVESMLEDEQGHLWMGGAGLVRFNPATGQWLRYVVEDGVQSNSFKVGAAWQASDGTCFFGGIKGLTYFKPRDIQPNPHAPVIRLTSLRIGNKPVLAHEQLNGHVILTKQIDKTTEITLKAAENDFSIDFVALNYANPGKHNYAYQLIGYNDTWVTPGPGQRSATFANLPEGDYQFMVKADNGEGHWVTRPAALHITVLPPWYRTNFAYMIYLTLIVLALIVYRRIALAQQKLKNTLALETFRAEKEKEVTDLKLRFFTNVSHELRTPLTLILGPMEELVSAKNVFHGFREKVVLMHQQTRKLLDLVNQLMEFRKVESGHVSLRASEGNIVNFLTELYLIFRLKAEELAMDYALEAPDTPIRMYFDRNKLEIIVTNLLSNALKYTPQGGKIRMRITVTGSPEKPGVFRAGKLQDNYLQLTVQDWGVGMKADEVSRIFDPYYQASHTETLRIMGTGIGLSLVKQFVEAHSGDISVESSPGQGTLFALRFPFGTAHLLPGDLLPTSAPSEPVTNFLPSLTEGESPVANLTVPTVPGAVRMLIVEDNSELRQYLQQLFEPAYEVFVAVDGLDGWEKTLSLLPGIVVSDVMMPRSDGLELCRKIKQHPKTMHIPVVLLTARVAVVHELEGLETGADEYMAKPFNPKILYAKIAVILQGRYLLKEYYQRQILLEPTEVTIPDPEKILLEKAMAIVEENLADPEFNVPGLVRKMGMSQSAFYRQIKAITGQTVVEFIRDVRMKRAAQLLASGTLRVSEVAAQVGMEDIKHFRKTFQSVYTISPSDYAKQHQELAKVD